jgi:hypothetical protein
MNPARTTYPLVVTKRCAGCGALVEVRYENSKQLDRKIYCGRPCGSKLQKVAGPQVLKVYIKKGRENERDYVAALRKHKGLKEVEE